MKYSIDLDKEFETIRLVSRSMWSTQVKILEKSFEEKLGHDYLEFIKRVYKTMYDYLQFDIDSNRYYYLLALPGLQIPVDHLRTLDTLNESQRLFLLDPRNEFTIEETKELVQIFALAPDFTVPERPVDRPIFTKDAKSYENFIELAIDENYKGSSLFQNLICRHWFWINHAPTIIAVFVLAKTYSEKMILQILRKCHQERFTPNAGNLERLAKSWESVKTLPASWGAEL